MAKVFRISKLKWYNFWLRLSGIPNWFKEYQSAKITFSIESRASSGTRFNLINLAYKRWPSFFPFVLPHEKDSVGIMFECMPNGIYRIMAYKIHNGVTHHFHLANTIQKNKFNCKASVYKDYVFFECENLLTHKITGYKMSIPKKEFKSITFPFNMGLDNNTILLGIY